MIEVMIEIPMTPRVRAAIDRMVAHRKDCERTTRMSESQSPYIIRVEGEAIRWNGEAMENDVWCISTWATDHFTGKQNA